MAKVSTSRTQVALEKLVSELEAELKALSSELADAKKLLESNRRIKNRNGKVKIDISGLNLIDAAKLFIANAENKIMSTEEIAEALEEAGYPTTSENFKNVVSTMLNKYKDTDGVLTSVGRGEWSVII